MICGNCGQKNSNDAKYCFCCGNELKNKKNHKKIIVVISVIIICFAAIAAVLAFTVTDTKGSNAEGDNVNEETDFKETQELVGFEAPAFNSIYASSMLSNQGQNTYYPENIKDGNMKTAWIEGSSGNGEGQWLEMTAESRQHISGFRIVNGYSKDKDIYVSNARVKELELIFNNGESEIINLKDEYAVYQDFELESPQDTASVKFKIVSVYAGLKYEDTCISEVEVY